MYFKYATNKLIRGNIQYSEIFKILENEYELKKELLNFELSEYYQIFEITLLCTYLTLINLCNEKDLIIPQKYIQRFKKEEKKENINKDFIDAKEKEEKKRKEDIKFIFEEIKAELFNFVLNYEEKSLYINFIEPQGYKSHIKRIYNELYRNKDMFGLDKSYKSMPELREYLLKKNAYQSNICGGKIIEIIKKEIIPNDESQKFVIKYNEFLKNNYKSNKKFYRGDIITQKFYETINLDIEDKCQIIKIYEEYVDNFMRLNEI